MAELYKMVKPAIHKIKSNYVSVIGIGKVDRDPDKIIDELRADSNDVSVQAVDAEVLYGIEHVLGILEITFEAEKRKIMLAKRREMDLMLRMAYTNQISVAFERGAIKKGKSGCFILFSDDKPKLQKLADRVMMNFDTDNSVLEPSKKKKEAIRAMLNLDGKKIDDSMFLQFILEKAAIISK